MEAEAFSTNAIMAHKVGQRVRFQIEEESRSNDGYDKGLGTIVAVYRSPWPYRVKVDDMPEDFGEDGTFVMSSSEIVEVDPVVVHAGPRTL